MPYNFETLPSRAGTGSMKWGDMLRDNPLIGPDIVPFTMADMELENPPELTRDLERYLHSAVLGYTGPTASYFKAVCDWMRRRHGWEVSGESILQSSGVVGAIYSAIRALSEPGEGVILLPPVYGPFYGAVERTGRRTINSPLIYSNGRYEIDFDDLQEKAAGANNRILLLCNPHNPVGRVWSREELTRLGRICIDNGVFIIDDEIHHDLIQPGFCHTVFAAISAEFAQNSVVCTSPGKSFNITGMQISNIFIDNEDVREKFQQEQDKTAFYTLNALAYQACESAYNRCEPWLDALLKHIESNRALLEEYLSENLPLVKPVRMEGTFLQWLDFQAMGIDTAERDALLESAHVFLDPGRLFGEQGERFARMNLACPGAVLSSALERMARALRL